MSSFHEAAADELDDAAPDFAFLYASPLLDTSSRQPLPLLDHNSECTEL